MSAERERLIAEFERMFGGRAAVLAEAPGRVNVIGEHTDYNEGFVLPVAIDRSVAVAAAPNGTNRVRVYSADYGECDEFGLEAVAQGSQGDWRNYVRGVAWALRETGHELQAADLAIGGDLPQGTGLASSAAIEMAVAGALARLCGIDIRNRELAVIAQQAENEFVGVQSGIMDQFASGLSRVGHALLIDCRSLQVEHIPLRLVEQGVSMVVIDSKIPRRLEETPYNQRREECAEAARLLGVPALRDATEETLEAQGEQLPNELYRRARHVVRENERVHAAVKAVSAGDIEEMGRLLYESHASLRDDMEVSTPQLDLLVALASETPGVLGARLTGAGFGGSTVNFVLRKAVERFREAVSKTYKAKTGLVAEAHVFQPVDALRVWNV